MTRILLLAITSVISTLITVRGTCKDEQGNVLTNVSSTIATQGTNGAVFGKRSDGFSIRCSYSPATEFSMDLWQLRKHNGATFVPLFTNIVSKNTETAGNGYENRGLSFTNKSTVSFPNISSTDVSKDQFECVIKLNSEKIECTETRMLNVFVAPNITLELVDENLLTILTIPGNVKVRVTGTDYLPGGATFTVMINNKNYTLNVTETNQDDGFQKFTTLFTYINDNPKNTNPVASLFMTVEDSVALIGETNISSGCTGRPGQGAIVALVSLLWRLIA